MHKLVKEGLTYDDVLLIPSESDLLLNEVNLSTNLTKNIILNTPIMSAGMDTVTESQMAIAMARQGGIGIIHKNLTTLQQATEVDKVKRSEHGVITDPFFLSPNNYVYEADAVMAKYHISGVPITENHKLVGIITNRDLRFETNHNKKVYEVMTREGLITTTEGTSLEEAKKILTLHKVEKLPIVDKEGMLKGLITIKDIEKTIKYPNSAKDKYGRLLVGAAISATSDCLERVEELVKSKVDVIVLDAINGHTSIIAKTVAILKNKFPELQVIAGNVVTKEGTLALIAAGADAIKVGMGPGSICTSRVVTGVGVPQITAIYDCAEAAKPYNIPIIADGGIKFSGDITKSIAAGASVCMIGSIFAGCDESPGTTELFQGRKYKVYRGMASIAANESISKDGYSQGEINKFIPEGVEGRVSFKGSLEDAMSQLTGGLRSGMTYCGCKDIKTLRENGKFVKMTNAGLKESHPHDIQITKEAPNYSIEY